jgi:hypothetical protein
MVPWLVAMCAYTPGPCFAADVMGVAVAAGDAVAGFAVVVAGAAGFVVVAGGLVVGAGFVVGAAGFVGAGFCVVGLAGVDV